MFKYIFKKFCYSFLLFNFIIIVMFFCVKLIPGDPIDAMYGQKKPTPVQREIKAKEIGLDRPLYQQFKKYFYNIYMKFDFGHSYYNNKNKALYIFLKAFKNTLQLSIISVFVGSFIGIFLGSLSAFWKDTNKVLILELFSIFVISIPTFVIGFLLKLGFAFYIPIFPFSGFEDISSMILPILTLSFVISALVFKMTQTVMYESLEQPYIMTAYAKGVSKNQIIFKHALKNALIPIIAYIGLIFSALIGGSIITEYVFNIKGVGHLMMESFSERDYPVIQCCIILLALFISVFNLFLEILYFWLEPKIKLQS